MSYITIGSDKTLELLNVRDGATGTALTSATITYTLYLTSTGVAVVGGTGSLTHVSGGDYSGTIESTITSTLTAGAVYHVIYVVTQSSYNAEIRDNFTAVPPGGGIIDPQTWSDITGISLATDADEVSVNRLCSAVASALTRKCYPILLEPKAITLAAFDAPTKPELFLPRPIRSISAIYVHPNAGGDSSVLDLTADLLTAGADYYSPSTDVLTGWNRTGIVYRRGSGCWGVGYRRGLGQLSYTAEADKGAVFVSMQAGPTTVDPAVQNAAAMATTMLFERRTKGMPLQSESWAGYSYSAAGPFTAEAAINSPEVAALLMSAGVLPIHVG